MPNCGLKRITRSIIPQRSTLINTALFDPTTGEQVNSALGRITRDRGPRLMQLAMRVNF